MLQYKIQFTNKQASIEFESYGTLFLVNVKKKTAKRFEQKIFFSVLLLWIPIHPSQNRGTNPMYLWTERCSDARLLIEFDAKPNLFKPTKIGWI